MNKLSIMLIYYNSCKITITMYKETLRKITSLSLLTILLTSTAAFAMPNALPQAHAATNANLFVSAENSQFNNYFAGPQVIQVIVSDPDIARLDQSYGEPLVTLQNGKRLHMAQATDGNWYAYFADRNAALNADSTSGLHGKGLDFGAFCASTTGNAVIGQDYPDTKGFAVARNGPALLAAVNGTQGGTSIGAACTGTDTPVSVPSEHVVRQNKTLNGQAPGGKLGQVSTNNIAFSNAWPVIQLFDFGSGSGNLATVAVDYNKAGGDQIVTLSFDRIPTNLISSSVDRTAYPVNTQMFLQVNDPQLNIDPTEEDSWTWGANATNSTLYYEAFTRNGAADADGTAGMQNLIGNLTTFMFNHNGKFTLNPATQGTPVTLYATNGKQILTSTAAGAGPGNSNQVRTNSIGFNSGPITFIEVGG